MIDNLGKPTFYFYFTVGGQVVLSFSPRKSSLVLAKAAFMAPGYRRDREAAGSRYLPP